MRDISTVLDAIMNEVPKEFYHREHLEAELHKIKSSARYCAPELMHMQWNRAAKALHFYLGSPEPGWKNRVALIFADQPQPPSCAGGSG